MKRTSVLCMVVWAAAALAGLEQLRAESVVHNSSAHFADGTFADTEDTGSGASPTIRCVYDLPFDGGDGRHGSISITTDPNTRVSCTGTAGSTTLTTALNCQAGDIICISQTRGPTAGAWELNKVVTDNGSTLTLLKPLAGTYVDSGASQAQAVLVPQYTNVTIGGGGPTNWNGDAGGIYVVMCNGTINVTGTLDASGRGYQGTTTFNRAGESYPGVGSSGTTANGGGGGAATDWCGGGGGGGYGSAGTTPDMACPDGQGGGTYGTATLSQMFLGSAGGTFNSDATGPSGSGGGAVILIGRTVSVAGTVLSNGSGGGSGSAYNVPPGSPGDKGASGGGAGGSILIRASQANIGSNLLRAVGGPGGAGNGVNGGKYAGTGGGGRIRIEYGREGLSGSITAGNYGTYSADYLPLRTTGTYTSAAINVPGAMSFGTLEWSATGGTSVRFRTRSAPTSVGLTTASWSEDLTASGSQITSPANEWIQYQAVLAGTTASTPTLSSVTINYGLNAAPTAFSLQSPTAGTTSTDGRPTFTWVTSSDPEAAQVTYAVKISSTAEFIEPVYRTVAGLLNTSYKPDMGEELANGEYYWRVLATDGSAATASTETLPLTVAVPTPTSPSLKAVVLDPATSKIARFVVSSELPPVAAYALNPSTGQYESLAGAVHTDGYNNRFVPNIPPDAATSVYFLCGPSQIPTAKSMFDLQYLKNTFRDTTLCYGNDGGSSLRLEGTTDYSFKIGVQPNLPTAVTVQLRKNADYSGNSAKITLSGPGVVGSGVATATMTAGPETWQQLTVTGTPNSRGVLTLKVESFSTAADGKLWIDEIAVSQ